MINFIIYLSNSPQICNKIFRENFREILKLLIKDKRFRTMESDAVSLYTSEKTTPHWNLKKFIIVADTGSLMSNGCEVINFYQLNST